VLFLVKFHSQIFYFKLINHAGHYVIEGVDPDSLISSRDGAVGMNVGPGNAMPSCGDWFTQP
jgi:hypothetical protein